MAEPWPAAEALGNTKVKNLPGFLARNIGPTSLAMRLSNWSHRLNARYVNCPRPGMKFNFMYVVFCSALAYSFTYNFTPIMKNHRWRDYH